MQIKWTTDEKLNPRKFNGKFNFSVFLFDNFCSSPMSPRDTGRSFGSVNHVM